MYVKTPIATIKPARDTSSSKYGGLFGARAYPKVIQLDSPIYAANHATARRRKRKRYTIDTNKIVARTYSIIQSNAETDAMILRSSGLDELSAKDKITNCDAAIEPRTTEMTQTSLGRDPCVDFIADLQHPDDASLSLHGGSIEPERQIPVEEAAGERG
jgi:hypothetical protein